MTDKQFKALKKGDKIQYKDRFGRIQIAIFSDDMYKRPAKNYIYYVPTSLFSPLTKMVKQTRHEPNKIIIHGCAYLARSIKVLEI